MLKTSETTILETLATASLDRVSGGGSVSPEESARYSPQAMLEAAEDWKRYVEENPEILKKGGVGHGPPPGKPLRSFLRQPLGPSLGSSGSQPRPSVRR